jgi:phage-related holin
MKKEEATNTKKWPPAPPNSSCYSLEFEDFVKKKIKSKVFEFLSVDEGISSRFYLHEAWIHIQKKSLFFKLFHTIFLLLSLQHCNTEVVVIIYIYNQLKISLLQNCSYISVRHLEICELLLSE